MTNLCSVPGWRWTQTSHGQIWGRLLIIWRLAFDRLFHCSTWSDSLDTSELTLNGLQYAKRCQRWNMAPQLGFASFLECDSSLFFTIRNDGKPKGDTRPISTDAIAGQLVGSSSHSDWRARKTTSTAVLYAGEFCSRLAPYALGDLPP